MILEPPQWLILVSIVVIQFALLTNAEVGIDLNPIKLWNGSVELQCTATGDLTDDNLIRLGCDIRESKFCRENCTIFCPLTNGKMSTLTFHTTYIRIINLLCMDSLESSIIFCLNVINSWRYF